MCPQYMGSPDETLLCAAGDVCKRTLSRWDSVSWQAWAICCQSSSGSALWPGCIVKGSCSTCSCSGLHVPQHQIHQNPRRILDAVRIKAGPSLRGRQSQRALLADAHWAGACLKVPCLQLVSSSGCSNVVPCLVCDWRAKCCLRALERSPAGSRGTELGHLGLLEGG